MQWEQMFWSPCLERKSCATMSKTVRRIVCRGDAELAKSHLRVAVKNNTVTGVRLVAVGKQKKGSSGLAGTKLK